MPAAPLGKQPGLYLNVKQESCSLDLQPLPRQLQGRAHAGPGVEGCRDGWRDHDPAEAPQGWQHPGSGGLRGSGCTFPGISTSSGSAFAAGRCRGGKGLTSSTRCLLGVPSGASQAPPTPGHTAPARWHLKAHKDHVPYGPWLRSKPKIPRRSLPRSALPSPSLDPWLVPPSRPALC